MSSLIEMLCVLAGKIGLVCWQLLHDLNATENLFFQTCCELSLFSFKLSKFVRYF